MTDNDKPTGDQPQEIAVGEPGWATQEAKRIAAEGMPDAPVQPETGTPEPDVPASEPDTQKAAGDETPAAETETPSTIDTEYTFGGKEFKEKLTPKQIAEARQMQRLYGQKSREHSDLQKQHESTQGELDALRKFKQTYGALADKLGTDSDFRERVYEDADLKGQEPNPLLEAVNAKLDPVLKVQAAQQLQAAQHTLQQNLIATMSGFDDTLTAETLQDIERMGKTLGYSDEVMLHPWTASGLYAAKKGLEARAGQTPDQTIEAATEAAKEVQKKAAAESKLPPPASPASATKPDKDPATITDKEAFYKNELDAGNIDQATYEVLLGKR